MRASVNLPSPTSIFTRDLHIQTGAKMNYSTHSPARLIHSWLPHVPHSYDSRVYSHVVFNHGLVIEVDGVKGVTLRAKFSIYHYLIGRLHVSRAFIRDSNTPWYVSFELLHAKAVRVQSFIDRWSKINTGDAWKGDGHPHINLYL